MNTNTDASHRAFVLKMVDKHQKHLPGLPVGHLPFSVVPAMHSLLADDTLRIVEVTKGKGTYTYLARS